VSCRFPSLRLQSSLLIRETTRSSRETRLRFGRNGETAIFSLLTYDLFKLCFYRCPLRLPIPHYTRASSDIVPLYLSNSNPLRACCNRNDDFRNCDRDAAKKRENKRSIFNRKKKQEILLKKNSYYICSLMGNMI